MVRLALVQAHLCPALQVEIAQPVEHEERALDAADFAQCDGQAVLAGIGGELPQDVARDHRACRHAGGEARDVRPVVADQADVDPSADQGLQGGMCCLGIEGVEPLVGQIPDPRREAEAQNGADGEYVIGEAAGALSREL